MKNIEININEFVSDYRKYGVNKTAKKYDLSTMSIYRILKKNNIKINNPERSKRVIFVDK